MNTLTFSLAAAAAFLALGAHAAVENTPLLASIEWTEQEGIKLIDGELRKTENTVAWGNFTNMVNATGWSFIEIQTDPKFPDKIQAFAAGYLEGYLSADLIYFHWQNTVEQDCSKNEKAKNICKDVKKYLAENDKYVRGNYNAKRSEDPYWHHVGLFYDQYDGMVAGYEKNELGNPSIPDGDLFWANIFGDLYDLKPAHAQLLKYDDPRDPGDGHCTGLIKLLPENQDLYISHSSWSTYNSLLRIIRKYTFGFHMTSSVGSELAPSQVTSFSGMPSVLNSGDDFILTDTGLAIIETTIANFNKKLWKFIRPSTVLEGIRVNVASRLATNGKEWCELFERENSGTYNNQYLVLDYNKFEKGQPLPEKDLLWMSEQLPGYVRNIDVTDVLKKQEYFASYNVPYQKDVYEISQWPSQVEKFGDWFTYENNPRAKMIRTRHTKVNDMNTMVSFMRENDFTHDPLSRCECDPPYSAENAMSARGDLNPKNGTYKIKSLGHRNHGGLDLKVTGADLIKDLRFVSVGGPTYGDVPPFQWSTADKTFGPHYGHPDLWMFTPITHKFVMPNIKSVWTENEEQ